MKNIVESIVQKHYFSTPKNIVPMGGGFYGRVFLAELHTAPYNLAVKIYLYPHLAKKEACQLKVLSAHSTVKIPEVYYVHMSNDDIPNDIIIMEYISGINAGDATLVIDDDNRNAIAESIIENLISYHKTINPKGFGEIDADSYESDWKLFYKPKADASLRKAELMCNSGKLDKSILLVFKNAIENYEGIFYLPITEARLIHGDYNTWNVLLDEDLTCVNAVIDPFNCCWADSELDLYQLNNANGKYYNLLDIYADKFPLSENFPLKMYFYELVSEINHYYDAGVDVNHSQLNATATALETQMKNFGLL